MFPEPAEVNTFRRWLGSNGAFIHPDLRFFKDSSGMSIRTTREILPETTLVSCPFLLAVTPDLSKRVLKAALKCTDQDLLDSLSERELICTYLVLHWILDENKDQNLVTSATGLIHLPYLRTLPSADALRTALHFNEKELSLLRGTNLFGATKDRRVERDAEWKRCQNFIRSIKPELETLFTWEQYLTASTYVSSRAFPSTLLSSTPSLISTPSSHPVLLPGVDALNHSRAQRVSWVISDVETKARGASLATGSTPGTPLQVSLVIHTLTEENAEVFNNYGPKPNSELILGYGFSLPGNPDDTIVLKIGGHSGAEGARWEVGRNAEGAKGLWDELRTIISHDTDDEIAEWEVDLDTADTLHEMIESKITHIPRLPTTAPTGVRDDVLRMIQHYVLGQKDILQSLLEFSNAKRESALSKARDEGVELMLDDEDGENGKGGVF